MGVREVSGAQIISDLLGKDAQVLMDPVFLNDVDFWKKYASSPKKVKGEYLLYYRLMGAKICDSEIIGLAKKLKLKLVIITSSFINPAIKATILRDVGPSEFLWLYEHASYVATDSFHGIAFSIIYKKQFVFLDRNYATNDRGLNLLSLLGIKESAYIDSYSCDNKIDYAAVDQLLSLKRKECLDYLEKNCT